MEKLNRILEFELINAGEFRIRVYTIGLVLLILVITKLVLWIIRKTLFLQLKNKQLDAGNTYALFQIIKYVIWVIAIALILESIGIKLTLLIAGSAALLVGVGLGLQQTFNDFVSGIILLSERSIKVNDILEIDGEVIIIQEIGLRTSKGLSRDEITIIIPNSQITTNKVINWSHQKQKTRFKIDVGIAYGSDVEFVIKVLEDCILENSAILNIELVEARLIGFGNSSLDFQVLFFSENVFRIEKVKSKIRRIISKKFIDNQITIPFPQMDLHLKSNYTDILNRK